MILHLKDIPEDVRRHILKIQSEVKIERNVSMYSQMQAIFKIIRDHKEFTDTKAKRSFL